MATKRTIEIYGQKNCSHCTRAVRFCEDFGYQFVYRDVADRADRIEMIRRNPKARTVPQIFVGETLIGGCDDLVALTTTQLQQMIGE